MTLGKWAIPQAPRCYLKKHAVSRNYRNDWCEYGGNCGACESLDGTKMICPIAKSYIEEGFDITPSGWRATRTLEDEGRRDTWSYGEKRCLLCERPAYPTAYYAPNFEGSEPTATIPLCQYHKATYMAHGIKKLSEMYRKGELKEFEA